MFLFFDTFCVFNLRDLSFLVAGSCVSGKRQSKQSMTTEIWRLRVRMAFYAKTNMAAFAVCLYSTTAALLFNAETTSSAVQLTQSHKLNVYSAVDYYSASVALVPAQQLSIPFSNTKQCTLIDFKA